MKFIAHRGYSLKFPENTLPAFNAVIEHPCNGTSLIGFECDLHLTGDNRIPVMHETTIADHNGTTHHVAHLTFDELLRFYRAGSDSTVDIPVLESLLDTVAHRTGICFEIKYGPYDLERFTRLFAEALSLYSPEGDVVVSSFSHEILEYIRSQLGGFNLRYAYIFNSFETLDRVPEPLLTSFDLLHPWYRLLLDFPEKFSGVGPPLRCWTVNDRTTLDQLINLASSLPIEAVMTDDLELARCIKGPQP